MARDRLPTTCTEADDCDRDLYRREHPRNSQLGARAHVDAPTEERVCPIHGVSASV